MRINEIAKLHKNRILFILIVRSAHVPVPTARFRAKEIGNEIYYYDFRFSTAFHLRRHEPRAITMSV